MKSRYATKAPTKQDRFLGERIKEARIAAGISQKDLGEMLGVSYQQVQKYEDGTNRVNGGRIGRLVTALNRPFEYFFPNATDVRAAVEPMLSQFISTKEGHWVASHWYLMSAGARRSIINLIPQLIQQQEQSNG